MHAPDRQELIMADLISLDGYGAYVWPAYAISAITLVALAIHIVLRARRARRRLSDLEKRHD
mgnify:FL=1